MSTFGNEFKWYVLPLNPEPWAVGPLSAHRGKNGKGMYASMGRNAQVSNYQDAVRTELHRQNATMVEIPEGYDGYEMVFVFHQVLEEYTTPGGRKSHRHAADSTNMTKATEDACQGVIISNDTHVLKTTIYTQRTKEQDAVPYVVIGVAPYIHINPNELPAEVWEGVDFIVAEHKGYIDQPWSDPNRDIKADIKEFAFRQVEDIF